MLTWGVRGVLGRWSPAGLGPEKAALLGAVAVGDSDVVRFTRIALCVAVGLGPRDAFLLAPPRVVICGITDVVVDEGVGFLRVRVHFILAVTSLGVRDLRGLLSQTAALSWDEVVILGDVFIRVM